MELINYLCSTTLVMSHLTRISSGLSITIVSARDAARHDNSVEISGHIMLAPAQKLYTK